MENETIRKITLEKYNHRKLEWLHDSLKFIALFIILFVAFRYIIGLSVVSGNSMNPTLKNGQVLIYLRTVREYKVGDIVCVWVPSGQYYVKRVVAVEGDTVDLSDGNLVINGQVYDDYAYGTTETETGGVIYPYTVSQDNYFVCGDNREVSIDSRSFGEVSDLQIKGKIIFSFGGGQ